MMRSRGGRYWPSFKYCLFAVLISLVGCANQADVAQQQQVEPSAQVNAAPMEVNSSSGTLLIEPTVVSYQPQTFNDPLESINRPIFAFNDVVYRYAFIPVAKGYTTVIPEPAQQSVSNFFANIREPLNAVNHLAQANGSSMGTSVARFLINSTVGLLGLFDPATAWFDIAEHKSTLGDTLESYGVDYGAFLVLPLLGPTDTRSGFSSIVEGIASPLNHVTDDPETVYLQALGGINEFAPRAESYEKLSAESDDPYAFFRNMYMQGLLRDAQYAEE